MDWWFFAAFSSGIAWDRGSMYNIHMNNKTNNIFRFKVKRPRQTFIQLDKEAETDKEEGS